MADLTVLFDRPLLVQRQMRAAALGPATFLLDRALGDLADRLDTILRQFEVAVDLGTPGALAAPVLAGHARVRRVVAMQAEAATLTDDPRILPLVANDELLPFRAESVDLVASILSLQTVNDLPGTLAQIRRALRPDGLFLAALLGGDTLCELRASFAEAEVETVGGVSPRIAPFVEVRTGGLLLQRAGFALPVADRDRVVVRYDTPFALLMDLRRMGATNALVDRRRVPLRRATLERMAKLYAERFSDPDGRVRATFDIVWLSGWAPHASQQKPLRPGSAVVRLADALGAKAWPAGEKP